MRSMLELGKENTTGNGVSSFAKLRASCSYVVVKRRRRITKPVISRGQTEEAENKEIKSVCDA